jgi:hypothetical protein
MKTKSNNDNVWTSFIENLHKHTAILASLLCIKFEYSNNKIIPGSLEFTDDGGVVDKKTKTHTIVTGHMNGYLIVPGIVYHLSTKLQKGVRHDRLGQDTEVKLIEFLT